MAVQIFGIISNALSNLVSWFLYIFAASDMSGLFLAVFFFLLIKRFLLDPLFRGAGSDQVKKRNKE